MYIRIFIICAFFALQCYEFAHSQIPNANENPSRTKTVPPAPNAASLGKYGEVPVGYYTGIPSISVPIAEAKSGNISVPVSLSYHAGGIKVEEVASWVGLGWSLNAGGVVTRTIQGVADEYVSYYGTYGETIEAVTDPNITTGARRLIEADILDGKADTEADIFHYNFNGHSGKFFFAGDGVTVYTVPREKIRIQIEYSQNPKKIARFIITTTDGIKYTFGKSPDNSLNGVEENTTYSMCHNGDWNLSEATPSTITSSWYLVEILSPTGDKVTFEYTGYNYSFRSFGNETAYFRDLRMSAGDCTNRTTFCYTRNQMSAKRLSRINFENGKIDFVIRPYDRVDLCGDRALEFINVFHGANTNPTKSFKLNYSYFKPNGSTMPIEGSSSCTPDSGIEYRLKLVSVNEISSNNVNKAPYSFQYDETNHLPKRLDESNSADAYAQDHWGYYNGQHNNCRGGTGGPPTLIPTFTSILSSSGFETVVGANRTASEAHAKSYVLNRINYPTGGFTSFEYESNKIPYDKAPMFMHTTTPRNAIVGLVSNANETGKSDTSLTFTVNSAFLGGAYVVIGLAETALYTGACTVEEPVVERKIYNASTNLEVASNPTQGSKIFLANGSYYMTLKRRSGYNCHSSFYMTANWSEYPSSSSMPDVSVGGLRVKRIKDHDGISSANDVVRRFSYQWFSNNTTSSGGMTGWPLYSWEYYVEPIGECVSVGPDQSTNIFKECYFQVWQSYSNYPLSTTQGGVVGYQNITVFHGENGENGKTEYTFTNWYNYPDVMYDVGFPFAPNTSYEHRRGLLLREQTYAKIGGTYTPLLRKTNVYEYSLFPSMTFSNTSLKLGVYGSYIYDPCMSMERTRLVFQKPYQTLTEWVTLKSTETKTFNPTDTSKSVVTKELYDYATAHQQVTKKTSIVAPEQIVEHYKYPLDYTVTSAATGSAKAIKAMQDAHIVTPIIEAYTVRQDENGSNARVVGGTINTFITRTRVDGSSFVVPDGIYAFESTTTPPLTGTASYATSAVSSNTLTFDSRYKLNDTYFSDEDGNLLEVKRPGDYITSYQWGYNNSLPIAEVKNAQNNFYYSVTKDSVDFFIVGPSTPQTVSKQFTTTYPGSVKLRFGTSSTPAYDLYLDYSWAPQGSGVVTKSVINGQTCGYQSESFMNVAAGSYTLTLTGRTNPAGSGINLCGYLVFPKLVSNGVKEFFHENFEEVTGTATAAPHTGKRYHTGDYTVPFTIPNSRSYKVEYWYLDNGKWMYATAAYTNGMQLTNGTAIDDVRVYPSDALMTTYTYDPAVGMTSSIDENGKVKYYDYDTFGRLSAIRTEDGIEKQVSYHYKE